LSPVPQIQIPANLPPQLLQQVYNNVLQQIQTVQNQPVDYENFLAAVEGKDSRSEFVVKGKIFATRLPDNNIAMNLMQISGSWTFRKNQ
jgi:hypothetical protein